MQINSLNLIRFTRLKTQDDKFRINGMLSIDITNEKGRKDFIRLPTIENIKYLLNEGTYLLEYEHSPKFKRKLWEFKHTENRSEIKFHFGSHSKHTKGCVLLDEHSLNILHSILDIETNYIINVKNY